MVAGRSVRAGKAFVELVLRDMVSAGLKRVQAKLKAFSASVRKMGAGMMRLGGLIAAPLALATVHFAKMGDELQKMSMRTGTSVEFLSRLSHAAQIAGTDIKAMEKGFMSQARFIRDAGAGLQTQARTLKALGLSFKDLKGLSPEDQFMVIADRLSKVQDKTLQAGLALQIFGRNGAAMLPMLAEGRAGLEGLMKEADRLGHTMSEDDANAAAELTDAFTRLWNSVKMGIFHLGAGLAPSMTDITDKIRTWSTVALEWIRTNRAWIILVAKIAAGLIAVGAALSLLAPVISTAAMAVGVLATAFQVLSGVVVFLVSPFGFIAGALVGMVAATGNLVRATNAAGGVLSDAWQGMRESAEWAFGGITDALLSGEWALAAEIAWLGIKSAWLSGTQGIREAWVGLKVWWKQSMLGMAHWFENLWKDIKTTLFGGWDEKDQRKYAAGIARMMDKRAGGGTKYQDALQKKLDERGPVSDRAAEQAQEVRDLNDNLRGEVGEEMRDIQEGIDAAKERLRLATVEAANKRQKHQRAGAAKGPEFVAPGMPKFDPADLPEWDAMETVKKIQPGGAFSAAAVARMGDFGQKKGIEKVADGMDKAVEKLGEMKEDVAVLPAIHRQILREGPGQFFK
jgi:hypothetical protein